MSEPTATPEARDTRDPWDRLKDQADEARKRGDQGAAADYLMALAADMYRNGYTSDARVYAARAGVLDYQGPDDADEDDDEIETWWKDDDLETEAQAQRETVAAVEAMNTQEGEHRP